MGWVIYLFGSGLIFFVGTGCLLMSLVMFAVRQRRWQLLLGNVGCLLGVILIGFSSTPLSYWFYGIAGVATLAALVAEQFSRADFRGLRCWLRTLAAGCWLVGMGMEVPYQIVPVVAVRGSPELYIIADSVTAGVGDDQVETWPRLLARLHHVHVHDFSRMGATVSSAFAQAEQLPKKGAFVLIEIGGNDVLGTTTVAEFERSLERLLTRVCTANTTVVMFEVPLPPLSNDFGRIQRRLAARFYVPLIPKRVLIGVLTGQDATIDSIHLSQAGHDHMAVVVWNIIRPVEEAH